MTTLADWLATIGLGRHAPRLLGEGIDFDVLCELDEADLELLGLPMGDRKRLLRAIRERAGGQVMRPAAAGGPVTGDPELRQVTVMFCDLVGSTLLSNHLELEDYREMLRAYQTLGERMVERSAGTVSRYMGDGFLALFGYPAADEHAAEHAARAALDIVAGVGELGGTLAELLDGHRLQVRVGMATGTVVAGDPIGKGASAEEAVAGEVPNLAARLQALAAPDTIVVSEKTRARLGGLFDVADLGTQALKGFPEPVRAWRLLGANAPETRFDASRPAGAPFTGRDGELNLMLRRWRRVRAGSGQVLLLTGEPGIGKSRLMRALGERIDEHLTFRYQCSPHHTNSALFPFIAHVERATRLAATDTADERVQKLRALLHPETEDVEEAVALFASLVSGVAADRERGVPIPAEEERLRLFRMLVGQLRLHARTTPVLFLIEDVHWIDPTSLGLLDRIVDEVRSERVMVVISSRPPVSDADDETRAHALLRQGDRRPWFDAIAVNRLNQGESELLVRRLAGERELPARVIEQIVERTDGVPLFIEEVLRSLPPADVLAADDDPAGLLHSVPTSLHDLLLARIDRLPRRARGVAQAAAAIGREFPLDLLRAVTSLDDGELAAAIDTLTAEHLVQRRQRPDGPCGLFRHALVQETAYQTLLRKGKRRELHAQIADALVHDFPERAARQPEIVAHHYTEAYLPEPALAQWARAGEHAAERSASVEAIHRFRRGIEMCGRLPASAEIRARELDLQLRLGAARASVDGYAAPALKPVYERAIELCRSLGDPPPLADALAGLSAYHYVRGDLDTAYDWGQRCLQVSRTSGDSGRLLEAHRLLGEELLYMGDLPASREHLEHCIALYDEDTHRQIAYVSGDDPAVLSHMYLAIALWFDGEPDRAGLVNSAGRHLAVRLQHRHTLAQSHFYTAWLQGLDGRAHEAEASAKAAISECEQYEFGMYLGLATVVAGWARAMTRGEVAGIGDMRRGIERLRGEEAGLTLSCFLPWLAEALLACGQPHEAREVIEECLATAGDRLYAPERLRLRGAILLELEGAGAEAEQSLVAAHEAARARGIRALEQRAAHSLCDLWQSQGRTREAETLLRSVERPGPPRSAGPRRPDSPARVDGQRDPRSLH